MKKPILSAKSDLVFKLIFGHPKRTDILADFLKSVLTIPEDEYESIEIVDPILKIEEIDDKIGILDIKIHTTSKIVIDVEIQVLPVSDMIERILFYHSKMITGQIIKGNDYDVIKKTISIIILDYTILKNNSYVNKFTLYDKHTLTELTDKIEINILELPKLPEIPDNTEIWKWLAFLKADKEEELMTLANKNPQIKKAVGVLKELSEDERLQMLEEYREKARRDEYARKKYIINEARTQGLEEGRQEGIQQGKYERNIEIAINLLSMNSPEEQISRATGLTLEEIKKIAQAQSL